MVVLFFFLQNATNDKAVKVKSVFPTLDRQWITFLLL